jgi:hypothetical protein
MNLLKKIMFNNANTKKIIIEDIGRELKQELDDKKLSLANSSRTYSSKILKLENRFNNLSVNDLIPLMKIYLESQTRIIKHDKEFLISIEIIY